MTTVNVHKKLLNKLSKYNVYSIIFFYMFEKGFIYHNDIRRINSGTLSQNPINFLIENNIIIKIDHEQICNNEEAKLLLREGYGRYHLEEKTIFYTYTKDFVEIFKKNKLFNQISDAIKNKVKHYFKKYKQKQKQIESMMNLRKFEKQIKQDLKNINIKDIENNLKNNFNKELSKKQIKNGLRLLNTQNLYYILKESIKTIKSNFFKTFKTKLHKEIFILRQIISSYLAITFTDANNL